MAFSHGKNAGVLAGGYVLTQYLRGMSISNEREMADASTFGTDFKRYVPGLNDSTASLEGLHDGEPNAIDEVLFAALTEVDSKVFSYGPNGVDVVADSIFSLLGFESTYEVTSDIGDVNQISAEVQADQVFQRGLVAQPMAVQAAAGQSASLDGGALSTPDGAFLFVHVVDPGLGITFTLQDSADDAVFADLAPTLLVDARSSDFVFVPGTIRQYVRVKWDAAGEFAAIVSRKR